MNGIGVSDIALRPCCENCRECEGFGVGRCKSLRPFAISLKLSSENCTQYTGLVRQCYKNDRPCACHVAKMMNGICFSPEIEGTPENGSPLKLVRTCLVCRCAQRVSGKNRGCYDNANIVMICFWQCALNRCHIVLTKSNCYDLGPLLVLLLTTTSTSTTG